jgi:hypothetical protein
LKKPCKDSTLAASGGNDVTTANKDGKRSTRDRWAVGLVIVALTMLSAFAATGMPAPSANAASEYEYSTTITTSTTTTTSTSTTTTTTPTVTKPGKGCGDKNHLHERRFECKVDIASVAKKEGKTGNNAFSFTVTLSGSPEDPVTVGFSTVSGTATAGIDFLANAGTLTFLQGVTARTITVYVLGDAVAEPNETFSVNLANVSPNAYIGTGQGLGSILNDD